jgi:YegS/Rv2252/BmrU family lipid kinase
MERLMLIINPISGTISKKGLASRIEARLKDYGFDVETRLTTCRGDATRLAGEAVNEGFDGVLACGGDGTVNETARALCGTNVALGIIPAGSGNGLARHIAIPIDPMLSLDVIRERHIVDCDFGTVNDNKFFCTFGVGFDAAVSDRFANSGHRGKMSYVKSAFQEFNTYKHQHYTLTANGETLVDDSFLIAVCNASQYGNNAYIAPDASITDGLLDIIVIRKASRARTFLVGFDLINGSIGSNRLIQTLKVNAATIHREVAGPAHLDGEPFVIGTDIHVACHPRQLRVFATTSKTQFRPMITPIESMLRDISITLSHIWRQ